MFKRWIIRYAAVMSALLLAGSILAAAAPNAQTTNAACPNFRTRLNGVRVARVTPGTPNNVRTAPGGQRIGQIPGGGTFDVLSGPQCQGGYTWWEVNYDGLVGWTAEGRDNEYYVEPVSTGTAGGTGGGTGGAGGGNTGSRTRALPSDIAQGIVFNAAGGGGGGSLCENIDGVSRPTLDGVETAAYARDIYDETTFELLPLENGTTVFVSYYDSLYDSIIASDTPAICTAYPINPGDAYALSPRGDTFSAAVTSMFDGGMQIQLPLNAYAEPGMWRLVFHSFELLIDVPTPTSPSLVQFGMMSASASPYVLLTGYLPNSEASVVVSNFEDAHGLVNVEIDSRGAALVNVPEIQTVVGILTPNVNTSWITFNISGVNDSGGVYQIPFEESLELVHDAVYGSGDPPLEGWACPNASPIRLTDGEEAVVVSAMTAHEDASTRSAVRAQLSAGDMIVIYGVMACEENTAWWDAYTPDGFYVGYVPESLNGSYVLSP